MKSFNKRHLRQQYIFSTYEDATIKHTSDITCDQDVEDLLWSLGSTIGSVIGSIHGADKDTYKLFLPLLKKAISESSEQVIEGKNDE